MKGWRWGVRLLAAVVALAVTAPAQSGPGEIRIEVRDQLGNPLAADGKLSGAGMERTFHTDADGKFTLEMVSFGRYTMQLSKDGFATQSALVDVQSPAPLVRTITMVVGAASYKVDVVSATPLPGVDLLATDVAAPVQTANALDLEASGALDLSDFLNRRLDGVYLNEIQGNPFQPDLNYRGHTASPLLGTPQGLSVYMDGVRLNQPFGDVVSWDLIPRVAISEITLMPGANPVFGLNTLGGALSLQTKDGTARQRSSIQLNGGSFGRGSAEVEHGGANLRGLNWYVAGNLFFEDGWREDSPSDVRQFFGKLGWQRSRTSVNLSLAYANNRLTGNGVQEQRFLDRDYASVYTKPDITSNRSPFLNLTARHAFRSALTVSGNAYYRYIRTNSFNGDLNEDSLDQSDYQPSAAEITALTNAGFRGFPTSGATAANTPFPFWRCIANVLLRDEPGEKCNGLLNRTLTRQQNFGLSGQLNWSGSAAGMRNQFTIGSAYDHSTVAFGQSTELGYLNPDRSVTGTGAFGDGVTGGNVDGVPFDTRVDLHGAINTGGVYATDTVSLTRQLALTLSGRYNRTSIDNSDRIVPVAGPGSLTSQEAFDRFNPAVGLTYNPVQRLNLYAGYSEASRAPTSIELGCADPDQPCKLPNAMAGDPPLRQVVARTWEAGIRGSAENAFTWGLNAFRDDNTNDILFVAAQQTGFGYFKNFGKTRRQGFDLNARGRISRFSYGGGYTFLDATYQSTETVDGSSNSTNQAAAGGVKGLDGIIEIASGNRIPLISRHMAKAFTNVQATSKLSVDLEMIAMSGMYARGNENNAHQPDGLYYLGSGKTSAYATLELSARYKLHARLELFGQVNNVFDHKYYTAAQLGPTGFTASGAFIARPFPAVAGEFPVQHATFYAPGAPRGAWGGLKVRF